MREPTPFVSPNPKKCSSIRLGPGDGVRDPRPRYGPDTVEILARVVRSARYVAGRNGALHGIQHAMNEVTPAERERLLSLVRKVASEDQSSEVRGYAAYTLTNGGCYKERVARK